MHVLQLPEKIDLGNGPADVVEAGDYLADDTVAAQLLILAGRGTMTPLAEVRPITGETKRILFMRAGGFGDLILLTPVLRELKRIMPEVHIGISCFHEYGPALANLPFVDEILKYPVTRDVADGFDAWVFLENAIEHNPEARTLHMTDVFAKLAGVNLGSADKMPEYRVKASEAIWAQEAYPRTPGTHRVCIQVGASGLCRVYPKGQMGAVARLLTQAGVEVFLLGRRGEVKTPEQLPTLLKNLANAELTFRQSCAVISQSDAFIGADSALLHIAGALAVPAVGLYGPFLWELRTKYCPTTVNIQGAAIEVGGKSCQCFHHMNQARHDHYPAHCPTKQEGHCGVLASIKPERVVHKVNELLKAANNVVAFPGVSANAVRE